MGVCEALSSVPGVAHVSIDPWTALVAVDHDPNRCGLAEMVAVLESLTPVGQPAER